MTRTVSLLAAVFVLAGCQSAAVVPAPVPTTAAVGEPAACVDPAIAIAADGKVSLQAAGGAPPAGGSCLPVRKLGATALESRSAGGKYRLTLGSPQGNLDSAEPKGTLVVKVFDAATGAAIKDATVAISFVHSVHGQGHGLDPNGVPAPLQPDGSYMVTPIAFPMAGAWLLAAKFKVGTVEDKALWAVDVL